MSSAAGRVVHAAVTSDPLDPVAAEAAVASRAAGAVVTFHGVIRDHDSGHTDVVGLTYTAHPDAGRVLAASVADVAAAHPGTLVWCAHRIGALDVGDDALVVAVAAAHRRAAFACCADVVDRVKADVPIWKEQHYSSGAHDWVGLR